MSGSTVPATAIDARPSRWWAAINGEPQGPYSEAYVRTKLAANQLSADALLCPVKGNEWRVAREWPAFHDVTSVAAVELDPTGLMLRCIGVYAVFIAPILLLLGLVASLTGNSSISRLSADSPIIGYAIGLELFGLVAGIGLTSCLAIGGWRLLKKTESGLNWTLWVLATGAVTGLVWLPTQFVWWALIDLHAPETANQPTAVGHTVIDLLSLAGLLFEIIALIWLILNRPLIAARLRRDT